MKYVVNLTGNRNSMDGSILGKVEDFKALPILSVDERHGC